MMPANSTSHAVNIYSFIGTLTFEQYLESIGQQFNHFEFSTCMWNHYDIMIYKGFNEICFWSIDGSIDFFVLFFA